MKRLATCRAAIRSKSDLFYSMFVEANPRIVLNKAVYQLVDKVFNIALTDENNNPVSITKLYLGDGSELSQGSSVFLEKEM